MNLAKTLFQAWLPWNTHDYNSTVMIIINISYIQRLSNLLILVHSPVILLRRLSHISSGWLECKALDCYTKSLHIYKLHCSQK